MRKLKARVGLLAIVALGLGLVSCGSDTASVTEETTAATAAPEVSTEPIKIGVVADLTGPFTLYGTSLARSAELAVDEINAAGGIMGRPVELIVEDIATDVAITTDKARKLVESDMVDVVMERL
jgi:ABC-type branched-subunit amino acid transport system substrate-binding protein